VPCCHEAAVIIVIDRASSEPPKKLHFFTLKKSFTFSEEMAPWRGLKVANQGRVQMERGKFWWKFFAFLTTN